MRIMDGKKTVLGGKKINNKYKSFIRVVPPPVSAKIARSIELWHQCLGHVSDNVIRAMAKNNLADDLEVILKKRDSCDFCHFGRQTLNPLATQGRRECLPGERFHSDVCQVGIISCRIWCRNMKCGFFFKKKTCKIR